MEVSDIISAVNIEEYISQYCDLEEKGGEMWGLSPFKDEKTPSFSVNPGNGYWYDFSTGYGGNLLDFVMRYHHVDLAHAVRLLKQYAHISDDAPSPVFLTASRVAKRFRVNKRPSKPRASAILSPDYMNLYPFRKDKLSLWAQEGISYETMRYFGVRYDPADDRIVYPVRNYNGDIISVCGRTCDPDYKAKKLRKYTYFQSIGTIDTLYGYSEHRNAIHQQKEIILFEGAKSVMLAHGWGIYNTAAILTSHISPDQFNFLVRLGNVHGVRLVFALDKDIRVAEIERVKKLASYAQVFYLQDDENLLNEKDSPVDQGVNIFRHLYECRKKVA